MRRIVLSILVTISCIDCAFAQSRTLKGHVSSNHQSLEFASVGVHGTTLGSITNASGLFEIKDIPAGKYKLLVSSIGFQSQVIPFEINETHHLQLNIELIESATSLDEVVVSGTMQEISKLESAIPVEVYSPTFFKANPAPSIFESLQNVNGVRPQLNCSVCNTGDIHINGLEGPYTMILIDGMPIVSGLSTVYGLTGIPQFLIERVEIVKGPASTLYGSEALGGLINIITKKPGNAPLFATDVMASQWGEVNTDIGIKFNLGKKVSSLMGINYFNYQNPIDNNDDGFTDMTLQNRISAFNKWSFKRKSNKPFTIATRVVHENRWGGEMNWQERHRGGDQIYGESIITNRWETFGTYQLPFEETINLSYSVNGHHQDSYYGTTSFDASQYVAFTQLTWHKDIKETHSLLFGAAYRYMHYNDNTVVTEINTDGNLTNEPSITRLPGIFIQDDIKLSLQSKLQAGLRYDYNNVHGSILSPRMNVKWNSLDKKNVIRIGIGNGFRVANVFTEDHAALTGSRTVEFEDELKPEQSWNANINMVKKIYTPTNQFLSIDFSAFYTHFTNRIVPDYETDPNKIIYANLDGSAVSKGASINLDLALTNGLKILAGTTLMDVSITENGSTERQLLTEKFSSVWSIGYTFPGSQITIDYTGNLYGPMRLPLISDQDPRDEYSPWWSTQNIQISKTFNNGFEIYGGIKNILNYTPPANSIARSHDPFDDTVDFDEDGMAIVTDSNPHGLTFDPSYVYASNQGIRGFFGVRYTLRK